MSNARELGDLGAAVNVDSGNVGIGGDTAGVVAGVSVTSKFCVKNEGGNPVAGFVHVNNTTAGSGSGTFACRSRGTTASPAVVQNNDSLWNMFVAGHDGTDLALAAQISVEVDGTPGNNDMPGRLMFSTTPDGSQAPVERMRISNNGSFSSVIPGGSTLLPDFACRAWVNFDGTTSPGTIRASGNVSSVTRNATGDFSVNFTTAMPDANFSAQVLCQRSGGFPYMGWGLHRSSATGTTFVRIETWSEGGYAAENPPIVCVSVSR